ncbi:hypothetical protein ZMTM_16670 [Methyloradius palustris]|uniref:Uncharacterized protein n=1 Tax=Methyloradius palustris TaxID=2778876 RepID=A0A8D5K156_9PROT|nr:hypothetical protein ZMTM_16670 [Methyloradius palustris]
MNKLQLSRDLDTGGAEYNNPLSGLNFLGCHLKDEDSGLNSGASFGRLNFIELLDF